MRRLTWFVDRCANGANTRYAFGTKLAADEFAAGQGKYLTVVFSGWVED